MDVNLWSSLKQYNICKKKTRALALFNITILVSSVIVIVLSQNVITNVSNNSAYAALAGSGIGSNNVGTTATTTDSPLVLPFSSNSVTPSDSTVSTTSTTNPCGKIPVATIKASGSYASTPPSNEWW